MEVHRHTLTYKPSHNKTPTLTHNPYLQWQTNRLEGEEDEGNRGGFDRRQFPTNRLEKNC